MIILNQQKQFRIIPSVFPPINFFEDLVDPSEMEILWEIESLTNERIRQEAGDIFLVSSKDRLSGPGSSVVMAAFTHIGRASRFTDGSFGIYYASFTQETAIKETLYHREKFFRTTREEPGEICMRVYEGVVQKELHDIRDKKFNILHHQENYIESQVFGKKMKDSNAWGLIYNSVRHPGGTCIAVLRPPAVSIPKSTLHLRYIWNGEKIVDVLEVHSLNLLKKFAESQTLGGLDWKSLRDEGGR